MQIVLDVETAAQVGAVAQLTGVSPNMLVNMILKNAFQRLGENGVTTAMLSAPSGDDERPPTNPPKLADQIRRWVNENCIQPARQSGRSEVVVRAGDVHRDMHLKNRLPAVCAALGSGIFLRLASVKEKKVDGPANGATTAFSFVLSSD